MITRILLFFVAISTLLLSINTDSKAQSNNKKIGVVFSGGGARGLSHIGFLKALEEKNIQVDYITGTSMGAIVGGMYASGYTPEEMEKFFCSDDLLSWVFGKDYTKMDIYVNKRPNDSKMISVPINLSDSNKNRIDITPNLLATTELEYKMMEVFNVANKKCKNNFDSLFIPFKCVATNIYTKKGKLFSSGDLYKTIRASMSIPVLFSPMEIDDTLYYDGGMSDNFPWTQMEEYYKPDVIIGSGCFEEKPKIDKKNLLKFIENFIITYKEIKMREEDIFIRQTLEGYGMMDFAKAKEIIDKGYEESIKYLNSIDISHLQQSNLDNFNKRRTDYFFSEDENYRIKDSLNILGLGEKETKFVKNFIDDKKRKREVSNIYNRYRYLLSLGYFNAESPNKKFDSLTGKDILNLSFSEKADLSLHLGAYVSTNSYNTLALGFEYKNISNFGYTLNTNINIGVYYNSAYVSNIFDFSTKLNPLTLKLDFIWNYNNHYDDDNFYITNPKDGFSYKSYEYFGSANLEYNISNTGIIGIKTSLGEHINKFYATENYKDTNSMSKASFKGFVVNAYLEKNTLNFKQFAYRGNFQRVSINYIGGKENFKAGDYIETKDASNIKHDWIAFSIKREDYIKIHKMFTLGIHSEFMYSNKPLFYSENIDMFVTNKLLPYFTPQFNPVYNTNSKILNSFRNNSYVHLGVEPIVTFTNTIYLKMGAFIYYPIDFTKEKIGSVLKAETLKANLKLYYKASFVYQSIMGPLALTMAYFHNAPKPFSAVLSFGFLLFNPTFFNY